MIRTRSSRAISTLSLSAMVLMVSRQQAAPTSVSTLLNCRSHRRRCWRASCSLLHCLIPTPTLKAWPSVGPLCWTPWWSRGRSRSNRHKPSSRSLWGCWNSRRVCRMVALLLAIEDSSVITCSITCPRRALTLMRSPRAVTPLTRPLIPQPRRPRDRR